MGFKNSGGVKKQYAAAIAGNLSMLASGAVMAWSSPALPAMVLTEDEESWAGSLAALGAAVGPWVGGWSADRLGRRAALLWSLVPFLAGWVMLMCAETLPGLLFAARVIMGVAVGITYTALPMYVGEIAQPDIRGALGTLMQLVITVGMLIVYSVGPYVPYLALGGLGIAFPILFGAVFFWMSETPYQYLQQGNEAAAEKALKSFRSDGQDVSEELRLMKEAVEESQRSKAGIGELFTVRGNLKALGLSMGLVAFQQLSGINAVLFYGQRIFELANTGLSGAVSLIIVAAVMLAASCLTPFVVDSLGRRILLIASAVGMIISETALGVYFYLQEHDGRDMSALGWLPVTSLVVYIAMYSPGFGALPWAVMGELFPTNVKGVASSLTASFCWLLAFLITKFFSGISTSLGSYTPFWFFAACCGAAALFVFFLLPETKGRTLEEIQDILNKK